MEKRILVVLACALLVLGAGVAHANLLSGGGFVGMSMNDNASGDAVSLDSSESLHGIDAVAVPIPGAVWLLGSGLVVLLGLRRRSRR